MGRGAARWRSGSAKSPQDNTFHFWRSLPSVRLRPVSVRWPTPLLARLEVELLSGKSHPLLNSSVPPRAGYASSA